MGLSVPGSRTASLNGAIRRLPVDDVNIEFSFQLHAGKEAMAAFAAL